MAGGMLKFLAADLVPNNTDPTKFYTDLYGGSANMSNDFRNLFETPDADMTDMINWAHANATHRPVAAWLEAC